MYRIALIFAGYDVQEARGGFEALRRLDSDPPDLVVLDLLLPGVDGFAVRQELAAHAHTRNIPIMIVTGSGENLDHLDVACLLRNLCRRMIWWTPCGSVSHPRQSLQAGCEFRSCRSYPAFVNLSAI